MKKLLIAAAGLVALAAPALAADMAPAPYTKAPPVMVAPVYNWTGFYIGVHGGGAWTNGDSTVDPLPSPAAFNRSADRFGLGGSGAVVGVQGGYNWQVSPVFLLGVEADWSWTNAKASAFAAVRDPTGVPFAGTNLTMVSRNLDGLGSARLRAGWINNNLLLYVTGGAAFGDVNFSGTTPSVPPGFTWAGNSRNTEFGYVVGAGAEFGITPNLVLRAEYLFYRLSGTSFVTNGVPAFPPFQIRYGWNDFDTQVGRVGLSYKFGGPVVARY